MSLNTFGHALRVTTWGESHGPALGCVVDGCPPGLALDEGAIQPWLDRRRPGQNRTTTQRQEADAVRILSGTFDGVTTGTPISLLIENTDQRSKDYGEIARQFRPGHADYTYHAKYGVRDPRGGGRSSARESVRSSSRASTAARAAAFLSAPKLMRSRSPSASTAPACAFRVAVAAAACARPAAVGVPPPLPAGGASSRAGAARRTVRAVHRTRLLAAHSNRRTLAGPGSARKRRRSGRAALQARSASSTAV